MNNDDTRPCDYCSECIGQFTFHIFASNADNTKLLSLGSFCLPECAAGYNTHYSSNVGSDECNMRHRLMEKHYGRNIKAAPPPKLLYKNNRVNGLKRAQWILQCREGLCKDDLEIASKELIGIGV